MQPQKYNDCGGGWGCVGGGVWVGVWGVGGGVGGYLLHAHILPKQTFYLGYSNTIIIAMTNS